MDEAIREQALKAMKRDHPDLPMEWLKMTYDFCVAHPDRAERIMNGDEETPPPKPRNITGGKCVVYNSVEEMEHIEKNVGKMELISTQ